QPYVRKGGKLKPANWDEAFKAIAKAVTGKKVAAIAGDLAPVEAMYALKSLISSLNGNVECRVDGAKLPSGNRSAYVGTATIEDIDTAEMIQLIGTNPRHEAPVLNARLRKAWSRGADIALVGKAVDLTYAYAHVGTDRAALDKLTKKKISAATKKAASLMIVGQGAIQGADGEDVLAVAMQLAEKSNSKLMILHTAASRVGGMDIGFTTKGGMKTALKDAQVIFNLGADEVEIADNPFVIYQGSHGDRGAHRADVILPAATYTEESGIFVNTEGRPQMAARAGFPPGDAKENWAILRALSAELEQVLPYDSLAQLRQALFAEFPHLAAIDVVPENKWKAIKPKEIKGKAFTNAISDYYLTNPIARASEVMAELSANANVRINAPVAAE
ncbi:MAG: molybdopterin-dependent oxidoreductase, partial [Amylibacter sp.]